MAYLPLANKRIFELRVNHTLTTTYHVAALSKEEAKAVIAQFPDQLPYFAVHSESSEPVIRSLREIPLKGDA